MTTSTSIPPSFDPQLLKLLAHHQQFQQTNTKEFLQHAFYYNHPPPNAVATNLPRHFLGNGSSKLNTENSLSSSSKYFSSSINHHGKIDQQQISNDSQIKKSLLPQIKESTDFDQWLQPPIGSLIQGPPCLQADKSTVADLKSETTLSSGERITCFIVGGEKRLCLPEILNTVLKDFSLQEINAACERLHIYCSRCSTEQLDILKMTQVLPLTAPSCGLITQTDAERLCANLLQLRYRGQLRSINSMGINQYERLYSIKVQHKCFGKCSGTLYPTLYVAPHAECIQCDQCQALFSPRTFVSHGHKSEENRICHWGFNSDNWRAYLRIRSTEDNKAREELDLVKEKFLNQNLISKKRNSDCLMSEEKHSKSDNWNGNNHFLYSQTSFSSIKKDPHEEEYSHSSSLSRNLPLLSTETSSNSRSRSSSLHAVRSSSSPLLDQPINSSITNFNDFSSDGIRNIVESTVSSIQARQQLLTYISQLQLAAYAHSSKDHSLIDNDNETILLRRENETLRERLSKYEGKRICSNSSTTSHISKISSNDHDDVESNFSSSSVTQESTINDQGKYFHRKRRLLAAEQTISLSETDISIIKKSNLSKKPCLDQIVDSLNQKAQAEQEDHEHIDDQSTEKEQDQHLNIEDEN